MQNKVIEYVKQYAMITLSISIMSVGVYFFKFPNNFVFGGVTGMAALAAKLTPLSASAFSSAANMVLLGVGLIFLGKKFAMTTGYATVVMSLELMVLEKICPLRGPLSDQPMLDLLFAPCRPLRRLCCSMWALPPAARMSLPSLWKSIPTSTTWRWRCS